MIFTLAPALSKRRTQSSWPIWVVYDDDDDDDDDVDDDGDDDIDVDVGVDDDDNDDDDLATCAAIHNGLAPSLLWESSGRPGCSSK